MYLTLTAMVNPVAWKAPTLSVMRRGSRMLPIAAPNAEVKAYQSALREQWEPLYEGDPIEVPVALEWHFNRQLVRYESASGRMVQKHRQDLTNLQKSSEDALQPWLLKNDVWVRESHAFIVRQEADVTDPYVRLKVTWL